MTVWFILKFSFASEILLRSVYCCHVKKEKRWGLKHSNVNFLFSYSNKGQQQIKKGKISFSVIDLDKQKAE